MVIRRGDIWWADLAAPRGSEGGHRRPVLVLQNDRLNSSGIRTIVAVPLSSVLTHAGAKSNVLLSPDRTGLAKPSIVITTLIDTVEKDEFLERVGSLDDETMYEIESVLLRTLDIER